MRTVVFGSCLSNLVAANLHVHFQYDQTHCIHHMRSDFFSKCYIDRTVALPDRAVMEIYQPADGFERFVEELYDNQYADKMGYRFLSYHSQQPGQDFLADMRDGVVELFLLDNYMDISAKLLTPRGKPHEQIFFNPSVFVPDDVARADRDFTFIDYQTPEDSAAKWRAIIGFLRELQPSARFVFLCFPASSSRLRDPVRFERAVGFHPALCAALHGQDVTIVPPLDAGEEHFQPGDWTHFTPVTYERLAGLVHRHLTAGMPIPGPAFDEFARSLMPAAAETSLATGAALP